MGTNDWGTPQQRLLATNIVVLDRLGRVAGAIAGVGSGLGPDYFSGWAR